MASTIEISGIGRNGIPGSNAGSVVWLTEADRAESKITDQMFTIAFSGYGPFFVVDMSEADGEGEGPVYEVNVPGVRSGKDRVADSFGEFWEKEVSLLLRADSDAEFAQGESSSRSSASYWKNRAKDFK